MKKWRGRKLYLVSLLGFGLFAGVVLLACAIVNLSFHHWTLPVSVIFFLTSSTLFLINERSRAKITRLISDNPILHIRTATISDLTETGTRHTKSETTEIIVSYFGILLGEKIIKFNQNGIRIKSVEIGGDFILFTYGTENHLQSIRLLMPPIGQTELEEISRKFFYETGIMPTVL